MKALRLFTRSIPFIMVVLGLLIQFAHAEVPGLANLSAAVSIPGGAATGQCGSYATVPQQICGNRQRPDYHSDCTEEAIRAQNPTAHQHGQAYLDSLRAYCTKQKYEAEDKACTDKVGQQAGLLQQECEWESTMQAANEQSQQVMEGMMQVAMACAQGKKMPCAMAAMMQAMKMADQAQQIAQKFVDAQRRQEVQAQLQALMEEFNPSNDDDDDGPPAPPPVIEAHEDDDPTHGIRTPKENLGKIIEDIVNSAANSSTTVTADNGHNSEGSAAGAGSGGASVSDSGKTEADADQISAALASLASNPEAFSQGLRDGSITADQIAQGQIPAGFQADAGSNALNNPTVRAELSGASFKSGDGGSEGGPTGLLSALSGPSAGRSPASLKLPTGKDVSTVSARAIKGDLAAQLAKKDTLPLGVIAHPEGGIGFLLDRITIHTRAAMLKVQAGR